MKRVLVFGAGGQVGQALLARGLHLGMSRFADGIEGFGRDADITDAGIVRACLADMHTMAVINCAVYRDVDAAEENQEAATQVNVHGVQNLADACREADIPLIHISSDYVFDGEASRPYREGDLAIPKTHFGLTKLQGETCAATAPKHIIIRTSWLYGPHGKNFAKTILAQAQRGEPIRRPGDQIGTPTHTADLAQAILTATERVMEDPGVSGLYHFAGAEPVSWAGFASEIVEAAGLSVPVIPISTAESGAKTARPAYSALDSSLFERTFGLRAAPRPQRIVETIAALSAANS